MLLSILDTQPTDIWHDTAFQLVVIAIVTLFAGIIGAIVAYWIYRKGLERKEISYSVLTDNPVLRVGEEVKSKIKIEFEDQEVVGMSLVVLKVWNSGNKSVKPQDYIDPVTFKFEGREVLDVSIQSMEPEYLIKPEDIKKYLEDNQPFPNNEQDTIKLPLMHLNSEKRTHLKESLTLKLLLSGSEGRISVEGKIDDGRIIAFSTAHKGLPNFVLILISLALIVGGTIGFSLIAPQPIQQLITQYELITGACTIILFFWVLLRIIRPYRCRCGYITWSANNMLTHVEKKHWC